MHPEESEVTSSLPLSKFCDDPNSKRIKLDKSLENSEQLLESGIDTENDIDNEVIEREYPRKQNPPELFPCKQCPELFFYQKKLEDHSTVCTPKKCRKTLSKKVIS